MAKEILKIRIDNGLGDNNPTFKDIELDDYSGKFPRMGFPDLTATLMWPTPLDDEWTHKEYVVLRGEKFYITDTPDAEKTNDKIPYKHDLGFTSEFARILGNTYFEDAVPSYSDTYDKPCSNSSKFTFYGTISELCDRLNCSFIKAGIADSILKTKTSLTTFDTPVGDGYCVMLDPYGDYDHDKTYEFSWEDKSHWDAITEGFNITEIPFERRGKCIIFGAVPKVVDHKFEYGHDNELLSVKHKNANAKVINRITMLGSTENIPHYYPNETEYGHITIVARPGNKVLSASNVVVGERNRMLSEIREGQYIRLWKESKDASQINVDNTKFYTSFMHIEDLALTQPKEVKVYPYGSTNGENIWYIKTSFKMTSGGYAKFTRLNGCIWSANQGSAAINNLIPSVGIYALKETGEDSGLLNQVKRKNDGTYDLGYLHEGDYDITFSIVFKRYYPEDMFFMVQSVSIVGVAIENTYWEVDGKKFSSLSKIGLSLNVGITDEMVGDGFGWKASGRMPFQDHLVPPKYRNTLGAERFYNALNAPYSEEYALEHEDAYIDPDTNNPYIFPNPFFKSTPCEDIYKNEDIKPTIEGVCNDVIKGYDDNGNPIYQLLGEIADIAYDIDDNDALKAESTEDNDKNDSLKYEHSFFYIKLNIFNGQYGFDLFAHASQTDAMTIQMREGSCNGCKFKIQSVKLTDNNGFEIYKNPIVVRDGVATGVVSEEGIKESDLDPTQQNTQTHSIWICVQKDAETFGVIMPNKSNNFKPAIGDKFNIINIDLPEAYIRVAEKRLEEEGMRYMLDNNEEKFSFDIQASRIFFAEHPEVLAQLDEYSVIKVKYNGREYEQYVNQLSIDCKSNESLPNIGIDLTDTLAVGQSFIEQVAERASTLIANPYTLGGVILGGGGLTTRLADMRYLRKDVSDKTKGLLSSDVGFEVGEFVSGGGGGIFYRDPETGHTYIEADKLKIRMKAIFEELEIAKVSTIGGKFIITPGGGINISFVEELANSYRCYFKAKDEDKGAECRFIVGDQVQCHEFNIQAGTHQNASNRYYWRLVTAVNNDESYIELSKSDCDTDSDAPMEGDTIVQLGNRNDDTRQSAIVLSTVDAFAPCVTLYNGIDHYSLDGKAVIEYGVDKTQNPPRPFFHCYGDMYIGDKDGKRYLKYTPEKGLVVRGSISSESTIVDDGGNESALDDYINNAMQDKIKDLQNQIDGVVETWNGTADPTKSNYPANEWTTNMDKQAHIGDVYFNIGAYEASSNPNAGHAWRWYYNSQTDYGWVEIADSDAVRALQLAQMSVLDTDVLYKQIDSQTEAPAPPTVNTSGVITDLKGWSTDAPDWKADKYIWQTTYVKKGDGSATFSNPTCISGRNGTNITISSQSVKYSTNHGATQPADNTFTLTSVPTLSAGQYLWSMTTVTYSNGQSTKSYAVSRIGTSVTITSTSVRYAKSTDTTQPTDSSFTYTTIGAVGLGKGDYLWTKTEVIYSDGTSTKSYTVSRIGSDGDDGLPGLPGDDGRTPYVHYAYANSANGQTDFSTTYFKDALYVGVCTDYNQADPTTYSSYEWSRLRGEDGTPAKIVVVNADTTAFVYKDNFATLVGPQSITLKATLQGTTGYQWSYKRAGESAWTNWPNADGVTDTVTSGYNGSVIGTAKSVTIRCTSGDVYDEVTIVKVSSGSNGNDAYTVLLTNESHIFEGDTEKAVVASTESSVIAYKGATQVAATIGTITGMPTGMTVTISNNGTTSAKFTVNVTNALTTKQGTLNIPVTVDGKTFTQVFSWSLSLKGKDGRGISSVVEQYAIHSSGSTAPADSEFSDGVKAMTDAKPYLWNREITTYTDNTSETTQAILIGVKGQNGDPGATVVSVTNYYLASASASGVTTSTTGWVTDASHTNATTDATKPYLWNYEVTKWSKGSDTKTDPHVVGKFGKDGKTPRITEQYFLSTSSTQLLGGSWEDKKPTWVAGCYYWTRSKIDYGDGDVEYTEGICVTPENGTSVLAEYSADGTNWHPSYQAGDVWMRTSSDGGQNWTSAIKIVGTDGDDGQYRKFQWAKNTSTSTAPTSGWQDEPMTASAGEYVWMRSGIVVPPATNPTTWDDATRVTGDKGAKGDPGSPVYMLDLSNEVMGILCNSSGTVTGQYSTSQASVWKGSTKLTSGVVYSKAQATGVSATVDSATGLVTPSNLTADNATIVVQAVVDGVTLQSTITLYKVKAGANGAAAVVYSIEPSVDNITKSIDGSLSASSLTCSVYKTTGNSARVATSEKTLTYQRLPDGATGTIAHTGGTSSAVNILADTESVIFELKDGNTLLDRERIPVVANGNDLPTLKDDIDTYDYLKEALKENTVINGGLVLSSLIKLGQGVTDGDSATISTVRAGMNGLWNNDLAGRTIASWWGGDMVDRFNKQNQAISPVPTNAANALVRMDGSAYFSQGNIGFNADGSGWLGHKTNGINFGADGSMTFASGIKIAGGSDTLQSLVNFMVGMQSLFVPEKSDGTTANWNDTNNIARIKATKGLYSTDFISARGVNSSGGGGSGNVWGLMKKWSEYSDSIANTDALSAGLGYELLMDKLSKDDAQSLYQPIGDYLTSHQSLDYINIKDVRGGDRLPEYFESKRMSAWFNQTGVPESGQLYSGLQMKGWTNDYGSWQLCASSAQNASRDKNLYFRVGKDKSWESWRKILDSDNYADIVDKIGKSTIGSSVKPIYLNNGAPSPCGYSFGNNANNVPISNGTLNTSLNADLVDGLHATSFARSSEAMWEDNETVGDWAKRVNSMPGFISRSDWGWSNSANLVLGDHTIDRQRYAAVDFRLGNLNGAWQQKAYLLLPTYSDSSMIYIAQLKTFETGGSVSTSIKRYADYDTILESNVASATKLENNTPFEAWGQVFFKNGIPQSISGDLSDVGVVNSHGRIIVASNLLTDNTYWASDYGHFSARSSHSLNPYMLGFGASEDGFGIIQSSRQGYGARPLIINPKGGNVGIGTPNPLYTLDVGGTANVSELRIGECVLKYENGGLHISKGVYSDEYISARGLNTYSGEGSSFGRLDDWSKYNAEGTDALSAKLGFGLKTRIEDLESKNYLDSLNISILGAGNAVTSVSQSADNKTLIFTKGTAFLTTHQSLAAYLKIDGSNGDSAGVSALLNKLTTGGNTPSDGDYYISQYANGGSATTTYHRRPMSALWSYVKGKSDNTYVKKSGDTMSGDLNLQTSRPFIRFNTTDGTLKTSVGYASEIGCTYIFNATISDGIRIYDNGLLAFKGYGIWHEGNDGSGSGLDADLLDGCHNGDISSNKILFSNGNDEGSFIDNLDNPDALDIGITFNRYKKTTSNAPINWENNANSVVNIFSGKYGASGVYGGQLAISNNSGHLYWRKWTNNAKSAWNKIVFDSDNVASATKLETSRNLWGQSFDGTHNVSGNMIDVGDIKTSQSSYGNYQICRGLMSGESMRIEPLDANGNWLTNCLTLGTNGNIKIGGIGTTSYKLDVVGVIHSSIGIFSDGYVSARGQNTSSDENLKFLERKFSIDVKKIANAPSWCFKWKSDGKDDVGSLAQYWQRINPLLTPKMSDGTLTLQYGKTALLGLISVAKKTVSHEDEIKQLKAEVKRLNKRIAQLERK